MNRKYPLGLVSMIEAKPKAENTKIFSKWFKSVICYGDLNEEFIYKTKDCGNVYYLSGVQIKEIDTECIYFVYIDNATERDLLDWTDKVHEGGYIGTDKMLKEITNGCRNVKRN